MSGAPPDAVVGSWVERAPPSIRPFLRLARYDRPVGFWLLAIPCWAGMALGRMSGGWRIEDALLAVLFALGAVAMRGAGCTLNDMLDRDLDAKVARTAERPLASGAVSMGAAGFFLLAQCAAGALVLIPLDPLARLVAVAAIPLVVAYPLMKRITWWPQAWLGLTFNWGVLVGYAAIAGRIDASVLWVYAGLAFWTLGYDTLYAHQDVEDDALIGVRSTARLFGERSLGAVAIAYVVAVVLIGVGAGLASPLAPATGVVAVFAFAPALAAQLRHARLKDPAWCLRAFRANQAAGLWLVFGLLIASLAA